MKLWIDFAPDIAPFVTDCPAFTIADQAKAVAIDYFRETRVWRSAAPVALCTIVAADDTYTVTNTAGQEIIGLPTVWLDGIEINEATPGKLRDFDIGKTGAVTDVLLLDGATIQLLPMPTAAGGVVKAIVAYAPTAAATGISDELYALYSATLRDLTLARLKSMQGKPWSDAAGGDADERAGMSASLYDSTMAGPTRRNRLRTKKALI